MGPDKKASLLHGVLSKSLNMNHLKNKTLNGHLEIADKRRLQQRNFLSISLRFLRDMVSEISAVKVKGEPQKEAIKASLFAC